CSNMSTIRSFSWDDVDLLSPPAFNDSILEALRLNELLARPQYKCDKSTRIGSEHFGFLICYDDNFVSANATIGTAVLLTGDIFEDPSFLRSLNPRRWVLFIPEKYAGLDQLGDVDVEVNYLMRLQYAEDWSINDIINDVAKRQFDSVFLSFYSPWIGGSLEIGGFNQMLEAPKLVAKLLPFLNTNQLQLLVKIEKKNGPNIILEWYRLIYRLFFEFNFALLGAESDGNCGRMLNKCTYRLSFVHFERYASEPPVFGFGSPVEERNRLIRYLKNIDKFLTCIDLNSDHSELPILCKETVSGKNNCSIIYLRYRSLTSLDGLSAFSDCELFYFSPLVDASLDSSIHTFHYGISPKANESILVPGERYGVQWKLLTFSEIIQKTARQHIDALLLDLDGGEWSILEAILSSPHELKKIQQISMRLRLWIGEENENYRRFYYQLLRLSDWGFKKLHFRAENHSTYYILFAKETI
uniref:Methyltransferase FkbM domain-containing protein n=1 Tax=Parascaris univalens TaxID=6257 RepID=A0A915CK67_PARUN